MQKWIIWYSTWSVWCPPPHKLAVWLSNLKGNLRKVPDCQFTGNSRSGPKTNNELFSHFGSNPPSYSNTTLSHTMCLILDSKAFWHYIVVHPRVAKATRFLSRIWHGFEVFENDSAVCIITSHWQLCQGIHNSNTYFLSQQFHCWDIFVIIYCFDVYSHSFAN